MEAKKTEIRGIRGAELEPNQKDRTPHLTEAGFVAREDETASEGAVREIEDSHLGSRKSDLLGPQFDWFIHYCSTYCSLLFLLFICNFVHELILLISFTSLDSSGGVSEVIHA
jgi:hypothetical protein